MEGAIAVAQQDMNFAIEGIGYEQVDISVMVDIGGGIGQGPKYARRFSRLEGAISITQENNHDAAAQGKVGFAVIIEVCHQCGEAVATVDIAARCKTALTVTQ